jgi:starch-binding outer membrane protein, SusD/RagB family
MFMRAHSRFRRVASLALVSGVLGLAACDLDDLLNVEDRDVVNPGTLEDPEVLPVVIAGALGDFTSAFGGGESYITVSALISDEVFSSGTFPTRTATDRREQFPAASGNTSDGTYVKLQFARRALNDAAIRVADVRGTTDDDDYRELKALEGYTMIYLAEGFCSAVPLSNVVDGGFVYGAPLSGMQLLDSAMVRFDAAPSSQLAAIGRGRALLDQGNFAAAAAAVAAVPTDWFYRTIHSEAGISNTVFSLQSNGRYSQSNLEGGNGEPFRVPEDPRAPWTDEGGGFDENIPQYTSNKYNDYSDPVILASGVEARLIEAEAALQATDYETMTTILNGLRAQTEDIMSDWVPNYSAQIDDATLAPLAEPTTAAAARDMLFSERAFWLYLTGHRLGDLRRLIYQYGLTQAEAYPTGEYHKGGTYGSDVVFPLDFDEANNPNFSHDMCDVKAATIN